MQARQIEHEQKMQQEAQSFQQTLEQNRVKFETFACACNYLMVIEECCPIRSFLVRKHLDFPDLERVVTSSMVDAVRKEICNNSEEETIHVSVSLPGLFGLAIIKTLEC